ncbi:hypothetical protein GYO_1802 [Bacillus spizizenii TU-B-10]|uniref:Uncharacterized protein n=1 Tax=Bacillus spizizenii (strain DSM 15029 / JCM 12233 / NBRC 101239 / NRRL B-23049 / TU-B-10) TaxID=1052585 RepID=G4NWP7_BACS4|nr:hypothetical protein GYO_1802 [Bacillus spizizenii TU-B-10]SCV40647.1 hypothetical protein BQ1740_1773 [Bacillus subtilis]
MLRSFIKVQKNMKSCYVFWHMYRLTLLYEKKILYDEK